MPISQYGVLNTTALTVPDLYIQIVPPTIISLNGVPSNVVGIVGTAVWGPVDNAVIAGSYGQYAALFGPVQPRRYDMGTVLYVAQQQGAANFRCVRVTDGTDVAASLLITSGATFTAFYTGTLGNSISLNFSAASGGTGTKVTISCPGLVSEVFDNILMGSFASAWQAIASAINNGQANGTPSSKLLVVSSASASGTPTLQTYLLSAGGTGTTSTAGTDGVATITSAVLTGVDGVGSARTGMYSLRGQGCGAVGLADCATAAAWSVEAAFAISEAAYIVDTGPSGDTIANALSTSASSGARSSWLKLMFGDWIWWADPVNGVLRLISPLGFVLGQLGASAPNQSTLNKQLFGVVASQRSGMNSGASTGTYSAAELASLVGGGWDVITNPGAAAVPIWTCRTGHNSNATIGSAQSDSYTRMNNFIAATLLAGMGVYVGQPITPTLFGNIRATQLGFLQNLLNAGYLSLNGDGSLPYSVKCDATNNPQQRTSLGYVQSDDAVTIQGINEKFIVNLQASSSTVTSQTATAQSAGLTTPSSF